MTEGPLLPQDRNLFGRISTGNDWLRSLLCTLARRGTHLRRQDPERAAELLRLLAPWPWFKGGQFLFDLLEWEDFMVDGPPPPPLPNVLQSENWERLDDLLKRVQALFEAVQSGPAFGFPVEAGVPGLSIEALADQFSSDEELPPLEPGLHLYRDVALGVWASAAAIRPGESNGGDD